MDAKWNPMQYYMFCRLNTKQNKNDFHSDLTLSMISNISSYCTTDGLLSGSEV